MTTQLSVIPLAFEENLVRVVKRDGEPWFVGIDVCRCLDLKKPENTLSSLDDDESYTLSKGVTNGLDGPNARIVISEPGVYRLVFRSRKPEAERFKRWLAHEVIPAIRKNGRFGPETGVSEPVPSEAVASLAVISLNLKLVKECRNLFGSERARGLWAELGLPEVPLAPPTAYDEAVQCLTHLLTAPSHDGNASIRDTLELAFEDDLNASVHIQASGLRVVATPSEGFVVANHHPRLAEIFAGTPWTRGRHARVLRRLAGSGISGSVRVDGVTRRGTLLAPDWLDEAKLFAG